MTLTVIRMALPGLLAAIGPLLLHPATAAAEQPAGNGKTIVLYGGVAHIRPSFHIDQTIDIGGTDWHFFTSEPTYHLGFHFGAALEIPLSGRDGLGFTAGFIYAHTKYWLNWEVPGSLSLDPIEASLGYSSVDLGGLYYVKVGRFMIEPSVTLSFAMTVLSLDIYGTEEEGEDSHIRLAFGLEPSMHLGRGVFFHLGYRATNLSKTTGHYKVERNIEFEGRFDGVVHQFLTGFSYRVQ